MYNENPAIVARFHIGFADEKKQTKSQSRMFYVKGSLVQRELSAKLTEGLF